MKLYAARHGETTWNVEKRILGTTPGTLTEKGRLQANELARQIAKLNIHYGYASDLARVVETTEIVINESSDLSIDYTPSLRERDFGTLEGQLMADVDWDGFWLLAPDDTRYGAESLHNFTTRIAQFILDVDIRVNQPIVLLSHIGVMNRLNYLSNPQDFKFIHYPNADKVAFDTEALVSNARAFLDGSISL